MTGHDETVRRALREMCNLQYSEIERFQLGEETNIHGHEKPTMPNM